MSNLVELKNISKYYITNKKNYVLKKINFKFKKGLIYLRDGQVILKGFYIRLIDILNN